MAQWPVPASQKEVRQFVGLVSYYRRFIQNFATIAKPLNRLTEKNAMLAYPNYSKPFILDTDASETGIGAVLSQTDDNGREQVIAYASRTLSKRERRYCVTRKQLLIVVTFICYFH